MRRKPYKLKPVKMGQSHPKYDLTKALTVADKLQDAEIVHKLLMRKRFRTTPVSF